MTVIRPPDFGSAGWFHSESALGGNLFSQKPSTFGSLTGLAVQIDRTCG